MSSDRLPFAPPDIGDEEIEEVVAALRSGWITTGPRVGQFEESFAEAVGGPAALATSSGTAAMHVALLAHGIGPGHAVVVPTMTFVSAAHVVEQVGAKPVFVDVEPGSLNIDPAGVAEAVAKSDVEVKCVLPVHLHGHPCNMQALMNIADGNDLKIVDDAAHALPAAAGRKKVGGWGNPRVLTAFSFYATKNLATGEGGMLTGSADLIEDARNWCLHGMTKDAWRRQESGAPWRYDVDRAGFKYNLSDIQAALGLVQLRRLGQMTARRRAIAQRYIEGLGGLEEIQLPATSPEVEVSWHIFAIRLHLDRLEIARDQFIGELRQRGVATSVHFIPIHTFGYYREKYGYTDEDLPVASREFERLVSLPIHPKMTEADTDKVVGEIASLVNQFRR